MLSELRNDIEKLKKYYDEGDMMSIRESIGGSQTCEAVLHQLTKLETTNIPDECKIDQLFECISELRNYEEAYDYLLSPNAYRNVVLEEIEGIIKNNNHKKR